MSKITKLRSANAYWDENNELKDIISGSKGGNGFRGNIDLDMLSSDEKDLLIIELDRRFSQLWDKVCFESKNELIDYSKLRSS